MEVESIRPQTEDEQVKAVYDDFVHFKDDEDMLKDTLFLYLMAKSIPRHSIMKAKKLFEKEYNIYI